MPEKKTKLRISFTVQGPDYPYHSPVTGDRIIPFSEIIEKTIINEMEGYDIEDLSIIEEGSDVSTPSL